MDRETILVLVAGAAILIGVHFFTKKTVVGAPPVLPSQDPTDDTTQQPQSGVQQATGIIGAIGSALGGVSDVVTSFGGWQQKTPDRS